MNPKHQYLVDGKHSFQDLVDVDRLREIFENFSHATGFTTGLVSHPDQEVLIRTGWQDICTKFHRAFPVSEVYCKQSNLELTSHLKQRKELNVRHCESGLVDGATPIIIKGIHVANLFTGQVFFQEPDYEVFRKQGQAYGYDLDLYLEALKKVPVVTEAAFKKALSFLSEMAVMLAEQGLTEMRIRETAQAARNSEAALREAREFLETAIAHSPSGILIADAPDVTIRMANEAAFGIRGGDKSILMGIDVAQHTATWQTYHLDGSPYPPEQLPLSRAVLRGETVRDVEVIIRDDAGNDHLVSANAAPICDEEGRVTAGIVVFHDITERKRAEEELIQYRDHLEELVEQRTRELQESQDQLQRSARLASLGTLTAGIAHEINNPLGSILMRSQLARAEKGDWKAAEVALLGVEKDVERCARIIRSMLKFARDEPTEQWPLDVNERLEFSIDAVRDYASSRHVRLELELSEGLPSVLGNPTELSQVLVNLARNAIEASRPGQVVTLRSKGTSELVQLIVEDAGRGIDAESQQRAFDPFFTTRQDQGGTGLGLSVSHGIVSGMGGSIRIQSTMGGGTVMTVELPACARGRDD
jgi:PAS domain S-box-containing protein